MSKEISDETANLRRLNEETARMVAAISPQPRKPVPPHTVGPEDLQFLEVGFLKPTTKNPRISNP